MMKCKRNRKHQRQVADLMAAGLTRLQAERELAARAGHDISDLKPQDRPGLRAV